MTFVTDRKGNLLEVREDDAEPLDIEGFAKYLAKLYIEYADQKDAELKERLSNESF